MSHGFCSTRRAEDLALLLLKDKTLPIIKPPFKDMIINALKVKNDHMSPEVAFMVSIYCMESMPVAMLKQ